jgi:hypothetical protein
MKDVESLEKLGATATNDYVISLTLPKEMNSDKSNPQKNDDGTLKKDSNGDTIPSNVNVATMKVYYYITINGVKSQMTSTLSLPTYYGITNA